MYGCVTHLRLNDGVFAFGGCDVQVCVDSHCDISRNETFNLTCSHECYLAAEWSITADPGEVNLPVAVAFAGVLLLLSGLFSGLTLGLMV